MLIYKCTCTCVMYGTSYFGLFLQQAVLNDFDYSDDEDDSLDQASRLARQRERESIPQPPPPLLQDK